MSNIEIFKKASQILASKWGVALADNFSFGLSSVTKEAVDKVYEYIQTSNDALYYLQVKTFLETEEIDQEDLNNFLSKNNDNSRLGFEIFKILEQTSTELQARMIARAFHLLVKQTITREKFDELIHVIPKLNKHLCRLIENMEPEQDLFDCKFTDINYNYQGGTLKFMTGENPLPYDEDVLIYDSKLTKYFDEELQDINLDFVGFGFLKEKETALTTDMISLPKTKYNRTPDLLWFIDNIFKD